MIDFTKWEGCTIHKAQLAKMNVFDNYMSDRFDDDIQLVTNSLDVITVEDWNKWYSLYYLTKNDNDDVILISFGFGDIIDGCDHYYYPSSIVEFALKNNLKIDIISYIAICKMYIEDTDCIEIGIPDCHLPTLEDLNKVLDTESKGIHSRYLISYKYDVSTAYKYVKNINE